LTEVARGLVMRRTVASAPKLVDYALRLGVGAVIRRLGYLMETCGIGVPEDVARLREKLTSTYSLLDPLLPPEGKFLARWRLRLNVSPEEIRAVERT
jgi:predicted transcriptional regulator of viral defense system